MAMLDVFVETELGRVDPELSVDRTVEVLDLVFVFELVEPGVWVEEDLARP